ncbi:hypothetical protein ABGN05_25010 [Aquibium sp. LZ166]|uniref:Uncharacterized protein n=1 Tax=Aquibium pacificus TaxID=3153579 RepID=A0ABV3SQC8_9HYPH
MDKEKNEAEQSAGKIVFSWPSALDITAYYDLIERLISDIAGLISREKRARYKPLKKIYDLFVLIHTDYVHLLANFQDAVQEAESARRDKGIGPSSNGDEILAAAKAEFLEQRKKRRNDRGEVKSFASSRLDNAVDTFERNFLYQLHWYFQYEASITKRGERPKSRSYDLYNDYLGKDKELLHRWDSYSTSLSVAIRKTENPRKILAYVNRAQRSADYRRGLVDLAFLELQREWGMLPRK